MALDLARDAWSCDRDHDRRSSARALRIAVGKPVLVIDRIAFTCHDVPVEMRRSVVDTRERACEADRGKGEA